MREVVPTLLELLSSGNRVNARFVDDCFTALVTRCRFKQLVSAVAEYADATRKGKSAYVREACATYCREIVLVWGQPYLDRYDEFFSQLGARGDHF